jgi:hypothetical protein
MRLYHATTRLSVNMSMKYMNMGTDTRATLPSWLMMSLPWGRGWRWGGGHDVGRWQLMRQSMAVVQLGRRPTNGLTLIENIT